MSNFNRRPVGSTRRGSRMYLSQTVQMSMLTSSIHCPVPLNDAFRRSDHGLLIAGEFAVAYLLQRIQASDDFDTPPSDTHVDRYCDAGEKCVENAFQTYCCRQACISRARCRPPVLYLKRPRWIPRRSMRHSPTDCPGRRSPASRECSSSPRLLE